MMAIKSRPAKRDKVKKGKSNSEVNTSVDVAAHKRVNDILLGPLERPALNWLAAHTPGWINPDVLTGIGVVGTLMIFAGYALTTVNPHFLWLASLGFFVNWYGDSLDGTLARYRHIERPKYGFFIDHIVDAFSQMIVFVGLGLSRYVQMEIALGTLVVYLLMSILAYVVTIVTGTFRISYGKIGPTEIRAIAILTNFVIFFFGDPILPTTFGDLTIFDIVMAFLGIVFLMVYVVNVIRQGKALWNIDQK